MARSLLGVKNRGTGFPQAYTVVGSTPTALGATFITQLIGVVTGGPFVAGETVTHSGGGSAVVTQVLSGRLILNSMNPSWAPAAGTITGGTSGATAAGAGVEGLEPAGTANKNVAHARAIKFGNVPYLVHYNTVYKLNQTTNFWEENYRFTLAPVGPDAAADSRRHIGLYIVNISRVPHLVTLYCNSTNGIYRAKSSDGASWSELNLTPNTKLLGPNVECDVWRNVLYTHSSGFTGHQSWDPETDSWAQVVGSNFNIDIKFTVWQDRLFAIQAGQPPVLYELVAGVWTLSATAIPNYNVTGYYFSFVSPSSGALITLVYDNATGFLKALKWTMVSGVVQAATDLPAVCPAAFAFNTLWKVEGYEDQESNALAGGPKKVLIWTATDDLPGTTRTNWEYVDDATAMQQWGTGCAVEVALPNVCGGGGNRSFFSGAFDARIVSDSGQRIGFIVYQQPGASAVTGVKARLVYGNKGEPPLLGFGTLANPSVGTISGGNENQGLTADGTTINFVDWLAVADGEVLYTRAQRAMFAYK